MRKLLILLFAICAIVRVSAQEKAPLITDRPDQTEAPSLVPAGGLQIETGFAIENDKSGDTKYKNTTLNTTLTKYGVNEFFELRLITEFLAEEISVPGETTIKASGLAPIAVGVKIKMADQKGFWPQASFIGHINLRKTSGDLQTENTFADFRFTFAHSLSEKFTLSYNLGAEWSGVDPEAAFLYTGSLGYVISDRIGCFIEGYSFFPENSKADNRADAGITFLITPMVQFDVSGGIGLSENAPDNFLSTGISFRFFK